MGLEDRDEHVDEIERILGNSSMKDSGEESNSNRMAFEMDFRK
jgi:hypothetical protein